MTAVAPAAAAGATTGRGRLPAADLRLFPPLRGLLPLGLLLAAWQVGASRLPPYFPPPAEWVVALRDLHAEGLLLPATASTLRTFAVGLGTAVLVGAVVGVAVGSVRPVDRALRPTLEFSRAMPPAAVVPIATLLLGFTGTMKVVVVSSAALWPVLLSTRSGMRHLDPVLLDVARSLRLRGWARLRKVVLPALLPSLFVGVRVAAPVALVITLLVEILTQVDGLGALIGLAQRQYQFALGYGLVLLAGLVNLGVTISVSTLHRYALRHRPPA